jgi:hypothetical protein
VKKERKNMAPQATVTQTTVRQVVTSDGKRTIRTLPAVQVVYPRNRSAWWFQRRESFIAGLYFACVLIFIVLSFATIQSGVTYLDEKSFLDFSIAWWVVLGVITLVSAAVWIFDVRSSLGYKNNDVPFRYDEVDNFQRHMSFWILFMVSLLGGIQLVVYQTFYGNVDVTGNAMAFVDYKVTFGFISSTFSVVVVVAVGWVGVIRSPMFVTDLAVDNLNDVADIFSSADTEDTGFEHEAEEKRGYLSIVTTYYSTTGEPLPTETAWHRKLLNRGTPARFRGFYWMALITSILSFILFGLMWVNILPGVTFLAGNGVLPWLIVYSCVAGVCLIILLIFYCWCSWAPHQLSHRYHESIQVYFWGICFATVAGFGGLLVFELDIGDFNVNTNPATYLDFKLLMLWGAYQVFFIVWLTGQFLMMPEELTYRAIKEVTVNGLIRTYMDPNRALGKAGAHYGKYGKKSGMRHRSVKRN